MKTLMAGTFQQFHQRFPMAEAIPALSWEARVLNISVRSVELYRDKVHDGTTKTKKAAAVFKLRYGCNLEGAPLVKIEESQGRKQYWLLRHHWVGTKRPHNEQVYYIPMHTISNGKD